MLLFDQFTGEWNNSNQRLTASTQINGNSMPIPNTGALAPVPSNVLANVTSILENKNAVSKVSEFTFPVTYIPLQVMKTNAARKMVLFTNTGDFPLHITLNNSNAQGMVLMPGGFLSFDEKDGEITKQEFFAWAEINVVSYTLPYPTGFLYTVEGL